MDTKPLFATVTVQTDNVSTISSSNVVNIARNSQDLGNNIKSNNQNNAAKITHTGLINKEQSKTLAEQRDRMQMHKHEVTFRIPMTSSMTVRELAKAALHRFAHSRHYRSFFPKVETELTAPSLSVKTVCVRSSEVQEAEIFAHDIVCDVVDVHRELIVIGIEKVARENHMQALKEESHVSKCIHKETRKRVRSLLSEDKASETRVEESSDVKSNDSNSLTMKKKCKEHNISTTTTVKDASTVELSARIPSDVKVCNKNLENMNAKQQENKHCAENYVFSPQELERRRHSVRSRNTTSNVCESHTSEIEEDSTKRKHTQAEEAEDVHEQEHEEEQVRNDIELINSNVISSNNVSNVDDVANRVFIENATVAQSTSNCVDQSTCHHLDNNCEENHEDDAKRVNEYDEHNTSTFAEVKEWACTEQSNGSSITEAGVCTLQTHGVQSKAHISAELEDDKIDNNNSEVVETEVHDMPAAHSVSIVETVFAPMSVMHHSEERVEHMEFEHEVKPESSTTQNNVETASHQTFESVTNLMCCTQNKHDEEVIIAEPPTLPRHCTPLRKRVLTSSSPVTEPLTSSSQRTPTVRPLRWGVDAEKYFDKDTYCDDPNKAKIKCEPQLLSPTPQLTPSTPQTTRTVGIRPHRNVHLPPYFQLLLSEEDYYDFKDDEK